MKIAIDAHSIGSQAGGNETYFRQLLHGLAQDPSDNRYIIFHAGPDGIPEIARDPRFSLVSIPKNPVLRMGIALPWLLRRTKPEVFHCQYVLPPFTRTKTVVTIHDLAHEHFPEFFHPLQGVRMRRQVRKTAVRADHITTVSKFSANDIERTYRVPREKISVAYQAPSDRFRPRDKQACREHLARTYKIDSPFILYVGRLQQRKNLPRLVEAYARLKRQETKLVIVGKKDWQAEMLFAKISELGLEKAVIFPGYVSDDDLPLFYNAAEVFVFPSIFEGFGLPVVESMASGVPTITSHGSSLEEVAGEGTLLVDPMDVSSISGAIERVLESRELQNQLIQRGLSRAAQLKPENFALKLLDTYRLLAG
ncbi:MAG TPA: glycosyltransferase family 1 protein [Candidatus Angelobacter sp.]|jgi:glycosyltransferase involved in cell wall biosynthesis|nr:glycosyltransferase family 1 protein [Candidatus Angelobacter sp.]